MAGWERHADVAAANQESEQGLPPRLVGTLKWALGAARTWQYEYDGEDWRRRFDILQRLIMTRLR